MEEIEETIIPLKFNRKLSFEEILTLVDKINEFTQATNTSMEIISLSSVNKRMSEDKVCGHPRDKRYKYNNEEYCGNCDNFLDFSENK